MRGRASIAGVVALCLGLVCAAPALAFDCAPQWTDAYKCLEHCGSCPAGEEGPTPGAPNPLWEMIGKAFGVRQAAPAAGADPAVQRAYDLDNLGVDAEKAGNMAQAADYYRQALHFTPNDPVIRRNLALASHSLGLSALNTNDFAGAQFGLTEDQRKAVAARDIAGAQAMVDAAIAARAAPANARPPLPASPWSGLRPDLGLGDPNPGVAVSDWTGLLDGDLNTPVFLDPAGFLSALPADVAKRAFVPAVVPQNTFYALSDAANAAVTARNRIDLMLKRQAAQ